MKLLYNIGVVGGSQADERYREISIELGRLLAQKKAIVFCGGMTGVMEWVSQGVNEAKGTIVGILPGSSMKAGNGHLTVKIPTGIGYARNFLIVRASEAIIAVDGSNGTLSEASFAVSEGKSVIIIGDLHLVRKKEQEGNIFNVNSAGEAVEIALREAAAHRDRDVENGAITH